MHKNELENVKYVIDDNDRRKNISFKNNNKDNELLIWAMYKSETYGFSGYIKNLIEKDMKEGKCDNDTSKSR